MTATKPVLIWRKRIADTETPVSAALKLFQAERGDFILESVEGGETRGRHSLIGIAPDLVFRAQGEKAEINREWLTDRDAFAPEALPALDALRALGDAVPDGRARGTAARFGLPCRLFRL